MATSENAVSATSTEPSVEFEAIEQQRAHEYVTEQIRRQIALGVIAPGNALPPERELARMFGVGRVTIQLAIAVLERERLIETRRGRSGGSFVLAPKEHSGAFDQRLLEVGQQADLIREAVGFRAVVEPAGARAAAKARTARHLAEIAAAAQRTAEADNDAEFMRQDTAFHLAVARASGNRLIVEAIEQTRIHLNSVLTLLPDSRTWHDLSVSEHDAILEAVRSRRADDAATLMAEHIDHTARSVTTLLKQLETRLRGARRAGD